MSSELYPSPSTVVQTFASVGKQVEGIRKCCLSFTLRVDKKGKVRCKTKEVFFQHSFFICTKRKMVSSWKKGFCCFSWKINLFVLKHLVPKEKDNVAGKKKSEMKKKEGGGITLNSLVFIECFEQGEEQKYIHWHTPGTVVFCFSRNKI